ncbi:tip elongation aberrant protein 1-like [Raphanus sativus]|uniref:Tip elongation aberrant protein 1-like n=1 Tax=Raphanus sativus TaxID=3726 RepID=A0A6J0KMG9_RAPSA|nr:tip elongation aberrant protein 1-like [Raphanus sativus]XP_018449159.1 tip elongation aberrant protein 1-like [Raphanus sativus]
MRWERVRQQQLGLGESSSSSGPGKRWGHTCNAVKGGTFLYVFGGYGSDNRQTNQVHVFDAAKQIWTQPMVSGTPPPPRDSHSCTTVGDNLIVFGGTDGIKSLNDLYILDTSSHTWKCQSVRGEGPAPREGHSATLVGKRLFVFGGCGKSPHVNDEIYYNDLYILNTETYVWKRAATIGCPPSARDSHTCSSWKNKILVIGGEDGHDYYLSDVHILDTDTFIWKELDTSGQLLTPRAGHVTVSLGRNLYVFGGFTDAQNLYDDLYVLDLDTCVWSKVLTIGEGPSARFSSAGACLDPHKSGFLVFLGGCNKNLEALDDMFYLHTGLGYDARLDQNVGSMSLKKQLKLKCQEQTHASSFGINMDHQGRGSFGLNNGQFDQGKMMFQAKVTERFPVGYSIETMIGGKVLRGVLFSTKQSSALATDHQSLSRKRPAMSNGDHDNSLKIPKSLSKDQTDATESKDSPSMGMEGGGGSGLISNPLDVNINTVEVAVAPQLDVGGNVNTAAAQSSSVPETEEASLESRNAVSIDVGATNKTGPGESSS